MENVHFVNSGVKGLLLTQSSSSADGANTVPLLQFVCVHLSIIVDVLFCFIIVSFRSPFVRNLRKVVLRNRGFFSK